MDISKAKDVLKTSSLPWGWEIETCKYAVYVKINA